jgi:hypothetical protein
MFGKMNFDDLQSRNDYDRWRAYGELHAAQLAVGVTAGTSLAGQHAA